MINFPTLRTDVYRIIQPLIGNLQLAGNTVPLIYNYQSDVAPPGPSGSPAQIYATFRFTNTKELGFPKELPVDNNGIAKIRHTYSLNINIMLVGQECYGEAANLHTRLSRPSVIDAFQAIGLHFYDRTEIKDIPKFKSTAWQDRNMFDFKFYLVIEDDDNQSWIEFVEIESTYEKPNGDIAYQETVTLDLIP